MTTTAPDPPPPPAQRPRRLVWRWLLPLAMLCALAASAWTEIREYRGAEAATAGAARQAAAAYASLVADRIDARIGGLQLVIRMLLLPRTAVPVPLAARALRGYMRLHPEFRAVALLTAENGTVLWSSHAAAPDFPRSGYAPLPANADCALGPIRQRPDGPVLPMRCGVRGEDGQPRYVVVAAYGVDGLLRQPLAGAPWTFALLDRRDGTVGGAWRNGRVLPSGGARVDVEGTPFAVAAAWPADLVRDEYLKDARIRWMLETGLLALLLGTYLGMQRQWRRQERQAERLRLESARLERQLLRDPLTDLPNRLALQQRLAETMARARRNGTRFAVGMIDLDDFKPVNDLWGHAAGDRLLRDLAARLQARLRETDLLARLGGDEFVVVLDNVDDRQPAQSLDVVLDRLHEAVETPFEVAPGQRAEVGMSLGLALYPGDAGEADGLLRLADAALYQAKTHKHDRVHWWQQSAAGAQAPPPETETALDPYGAEAVDLLTRAQARLAAVTLAFVNSYYDHLAGESQAQAIIARLTEEEMQRLKTHQAEHLRELLDPTVQRADVAQHAARLGQVHALVGVDSALLVQALALYRRLLSEHLNQAALLSRSRYRLLLVAECRLQDDIQAQLHAESETIGSYFAALANPMPAPGALWADVSQAEMDALGQLPGVLDLAIFRPDAHGIFQLEAMAGPQSETFRVITLDPRYQPNLDERSPLGHALVSRAWRGKEVLSTPAYALDERFSAWHAVLTPLGVRSALAIPILDAAGRPVAAVRLFGAYPNQFESPWMRQFAQGLQQRMNEIWQRCSTPTATAVLPQKIAQIYRTRLFAGGLTMHMQPVIDLRTGKTVKAEALARLRLEDGSLIGPGSFLPLLGNTELDCLFRLGLAEALQWLARWHTEDWPIGASVNLPPATLLDPACASWVGEALARSGVPAGSLTLEILETQSFGAGTQDTAIAKLLDLGVKLSMDDLGSGYSSLQRLSETPFDDVKIDQSLLRQLRADPVRTLGLIGALIQMGQDFGQDVVVEGLEDLGMVEAVAVLGAPYGQGYGLARPMPAEALAAWRRDFRLPIEPGTLHTYLGALAYHWRFLHSSEPSYPSSGSECPLARFLAKQRLADSLPGRWHAQLRQGMEGQAAGQALLDWLVEQVRQETAPPPDATDAAAASCDLAMRP